MISKTEISSAGAFGKYMKEEQAQAEYYTGEKPPSEWQGKGAEIQGLLDKDVTLDELTRQLEGKVVEVDKETGGLKDKTLESVRGDHKAGWDFTIAAPKSVSIESEVFGHKDVREAHEAAVQKAMDFLEKYGAQTRINGETVHTENLTYAKVQHATSRAGDPQTHTHVVIANVTYDKDGKAYSLESKGIYDLRTTADAVYKAELAGELEKLGYQTEWDKSGSFEIKGYTKEQLDSFSKRSAEMDAALRAKGIDPETASSAQRQQAALETRKGKDHSEIATDHRQGWQKEAGAVGIKDKQRSPEQSAAPATEKGIAGSNAVASAMNHLTEREAAFREKDLIKESLRFGEGKAGITDIEKAIRDQIKSGDLIQRGDGKFTTKEAIQAEKDMGMHLSDGIGAHDAVMTKTEFDKALAAFEAKKGFNLSDEQRAASAMILTKDDRFQGVQGLAGTGKTTMLDFVREAAESKGWEVKGFSNGGAQADKMQSESGIQSTTTARYLIDAAQQAKDAVLAQKALDTYDKNQGVFGKEPDWKDLDKQVKAGEAVREFDSQKRMFVTDKQGNTWTRGLYEKVAQTESKNLSHGGLTSTTYKDTPNGVFKSGAGAGGLIAEAAGALREKLNESRVDAVTAKFNELKNPTDAQTKAFNADLKTAKELDNSKLQKAIDTVKRAPANYVLKNNERWQKCNQLEAAAARAQMASETRALHTKEAEALKAQAQTGGASKTLQICDEASMSGQREFNSVIKATQQAGARTVFLGDKLQHQSVEAGKAFENAQKSMPVSVLGEASIRRQQNEQAKGTVSKIIEGKHEEATRALPTKEINNAQQSVREKYADKDDMSAREKAAMRNELKEAAKADNQSVIKALAKDYTAQDRAGRDKTIVITATNADRNAINNEIRNNLKAQGELQNGSKIETFEKTGLTKEEAKHAVNYGKGQVVEFDGKDKSLGIEKGDRATIEKIDSRTNIVTAKLDNGREISFNPEKKETELYNKQEREFAAGDKIAFTKNDKDLDVKNGQSGSVEKIDGKEMTIKIDAKVVGGDKIIFNKDDDKLGVKAGDSATVSKADDKSMSVTLSNGKAAELDKEQSKNVSPTRTLDISKDKHLDHGYAVTSHKSQGQTVEKAMVHHNTEAGRHGDRETYVNDTRMKESTTIYTQDAEKAAKQSGQTMDKESAILDKPQQQSKDSAERLEAKGDEASKRDQAASRNVDTEKTHDPAKSENQPVASKEQELSKGLDVEGAKDAHEQAVRENPGYDRESYDKLVSDFEKAFDPAKSENQPVARDPAESEQNSKEQEISKGLDVEGAKDAHEQAARENPGYGRESYDKLGEQFDAAIDKNAEQSKAKPEAENEQVKPEAQQAQQPQRDPLGEALREGKSRKEVEAETKSGTKSENGKQESGKSSETKEKAKSEQQASKTKSRDDGLER